MIMLAEFSDRLSMGRLRCLADCCAQICSMTRAIVK
jgi:hypothetical protein